MPHIKSNIPQNARSSLYLRDFILKAKELLERTKQQGFKRDITTTSLRK